MDGTRTRYFQIMNLVLCQMSYHSISPAVQNPCPEHVAVIIVLMNANAPLVPREWCIHFGSPRQNLPNANRRVALLSAVTPEESKCGAMTPTKNTRRQADIGRVVSR